MTTSSIFQVSSYALGLVFIFIVAIIWALASILVQYLYNDTSFDAPFLLTYIGTSLFTVLLPIHWIYERCNKYWMKNSNLPQHNHHEWERIRTSDSIEEDDQNDNNANETIDNRIGIVDETTTTPAATNSDDDDNEDENDVGERNETGPNHRITTRDNHTFDNTANAAVDTSHDPHRHHDHNIPATTQWTNRDHVIAAAKIAPMWFISNYAYNASLRYTSITSSTVLVNTGSLFTFLFAVLMRDEHFNWWKVIGVMCGISGSALTGLHDWNGGGGGTSNDNDGSNFNNNGDVEPNNNSTRFLRFFMSNAMMTSNRIFMEDESTNTNFYDDNNSNNNTNDDNNLIWGDILSIFSAVFYGVYAVMVRVLCPHDESLMSMQLFLGYVGLWNMVVLSPIAIWQITGDSASSLTWWVFECLVLKGLLDNVLSDYLWARAVVLTSATVATVGLGLTIPLAFVSDVFLGRADVLNFESVTGAVAVLTGFVLVNMGQKKDESEHNPDHSHTDASGVHRRPHPPSTAVAETTPLGQELPRVGIESSRNNNTIFTQTDPSMNHHRHLTSTHHQHLSMDESANSERYKDQIERSG